ncbi:MAG: hypothetical protein G01um101416_16 [Microgenomates group bacterium Gr01-1014_16]|nr:MAG: hypothetical protein G01um101416_16 [Microgenomates group bacterium Gr01-1014_16]
MSKLKLAIIFINLALLGAQFLLTSAYSAAGREISGVSSQVSEIKSQNSQLQLAIWGKSSLASIQASAAGLNFIHTNATVLSPLSTAMAP